MTVEVTQGGGRSVAFITLGCAKNEVDSEKMRAKAKAAGYHIEQDPEKADAVVINTCSFIQSATEESLEAIFEAAGMENVASGDAKLIVAGCMPARYGDELEAELTEACAAALLKKAPEFDVILTAEAKGIPLAYEMARQSGKYWIPARKGAKLYMKEPVIIEDQSITTAGKQTLVIDKKDIDYMNGKRILIVDDVISTGGSLHALETLAAKSTGTVVGCCAALAEGDAAKRTDIFFLEPLPLFAH